MRQGSNWVATDYNPVQRCYQSEKFYYYAYPDVNNRRFLIRWYMTTEVASGNQRATYFLCRGTQSLWVNGSHVINMGSSYSSYKRGKRVTVHRGFTDPGSWLDRHHNCGEFFDKNGNYTGIRRWVNCLGTNWATGTFWLPANNYGDGRFSVSGSFTWFGRTLTFSRTFDVHSESLRRRYSVKFDSNMDEFRDEDKKVSNMPSSITRLHGRDLNLPKNIPENITNNYIFKEWSNSKKDSFSYLDSAKTFKPGSSYGLDGNQTLYAIWKKKDYQVSIDVSNKTTFVDYKINTWMKRYMVDNRPWTLTDNTKLSAMIPYNSEVVLPYDTYLNTVYGCHLYSWTINNTTKGTTETKLVKLTNQKQSSETKIDILGTTQITPNFKPSKFNVTLLSYPEYNKENPVRTLTCTFKDKVKGDLSYTGKIPPGCEFIGWSTNKFPKPINPGSEPPIKNDGINPISTEQLLNYYADTLYLGRTDTEIDRTFLFGENIVLYPVFRFLTSIYIYSNNAWHLAMPYIYSNNKWNICLGYDYGKDNKWHI